MPDEKQVNHATPGQKLAALYLQKQVHSLGQEFQDLQSSKLTGCRRILLESHLARKLDQYILHLQDSLVKQLLARAEDGVWNTRPSVKAYLGEVIREFLLDVAYKDVE